MPIAYLDHMYTHGHEVDSEIRGQGRMDVALHISTLDSRHKSRRADIA